MADGAEAWRVGMSFGVPAELPGIEPFPVPGRGMMVDVRHYVVWDRREQKPSVQHDVHPPGGPADRHAGRQEALACVRAAVVEHRRRCHLGRWLECLVHNVG